MEKLKTGVAYHSNRILKHIEEDMCDIVKHNMNTVVHMFTHNDWDRHLGVMKDVVDISTSYGLEVWIDNWGLGGPPGDKSHFLEYHPESHAVWSDGSINPTKACYNSEAFIQFTKDWLDAVRSFGGQHIMWDEPSLATKEVDGKQLYLCRCETCQKLFEEQYNKPMPTELTEEVKSFRRQSVYNYFNKVTSYARLLGMTNISCIEPNDADVSMGIIDLETMDNIGTDPYWLPGNPQRDYNPYDFVYEQTKALLAETEKRGKDHNIWIQGFEVPEGHETDIFMATDAAYDAGARTILDWSFRGAESNTYKSKNCDMIWQCMGEAMRRIQDRHMDATRNERLSKYKK